ncbi:MAG: transposase, partial [Bryobacteraceae bacterium]
MHARKQYLADIEKAYERADEGGRTRLLDEAQKRTGYHRKYLIRVLNRAVKPKAVKRRKRRRRAEYGAAVTTALVTMWDIFEQPCGQRLAAILKSQLDRLRRL